MVQHMIQVHLTDSDFNDTDVESATLAPIGATLQRHACRTADDVVATCQDADALIVQWAPITRDVLASLPRVRAIARFGIGVDMIDVAAATERGVAVCNTPEYCIDEVATHALSMLLAQARALPRLQAAIASHRWGFGAVDTPIHNLARRTLGLVGIGRIGSRLAEFCRPLGLQLIGYDPYARDGQIPLLSFEELLTRSDFISIHCPLTEETRNLFDAEAFARMKPSAYLINTSRGGIVSSKALEQALHNGVIAGAALDVLPVEPPAWDDPLLKAPNLLLTPHVSWYAEGVTERMRREASAALVQLFSHERPAGLLNPTVLRADHALTGM